MWDSIQKLRRKAGKYAAVFRITLKNHLAYLYDFVVRTIFLLIILFVFTELWTATYQVTGKSKIDGYTLPVLIWYLTATEAMIMAYPRLSETVEQEVKSGQVAIQLIRPLSYAGFHFSAFAAEFLLRLSVNMVIGGLLVFLLFGPPPLDAGHVVRFLLFLITAVIIHYCFTMTLSLLAFWVEEARGFELIYTRLLMTIGGMMLPLEIFPDWMERVLLMLPFQAVIYLPAKMLVTDPPGNWKFLWLGQLGWAVAAFLLLLFIYRLGVRKLDLNGG